MDELILASSWSVILYAYILTLESYSLLPDCSVATCLGEATVDVFLEIRFSSGGKPASIPSSGLFIL